jgi:hypothetical protein
MHNAPAAPKARLTRSIPVVSPELTDALLR